MQNNPKDKVVPNFIYVNLLALLSRTRLVMTFLPPNGAPSYKAHFSLFDNPSSNLYGTSINCLV